MSCARACKSARCVSRTLWWIGSTIAWWHDPLINWFQPVLFYNAGLVNFGNWMENVPGSLSAGSRLMAEPV
ncbi:MAG: spirocyclase AveC family protein [Mycobacterium sp.]